MTNQHAIVCDIAVCVCLSDVLVKCIDRNVHRRVLQIAQVVFRNGCSGLRRAWERRNAAIPGQFKGDALIRFAFRIKRRQRGEIRVGVNVDKARRYDFSSCVDHLFRFGIALCCNLGNTPVLNTDVRLIGRSACAVYDRTAANNQIIHNSPPVLYCVRTMAFALKTQKILMTGKNPCLQDFAGYTTRSKPRSHR